MLALINLIIRRTRLAFRTPARFALVLRSLPALPVPRHDFDRGFEATGAGCVCVGGGCSRRDRNRGGRKRIARVQPDPCPLVTRLGSGSRTHRLRAPLAQRAPLRRPCRQRAQVSASRTGPLSRPGKTLSAPGPRWACGLHLACTGFPNTALSRNQGSAASLNPPRWP